MLKLAVFAGFLFQLTTQTTIVDDDELFDQNRTSGDWHWPTYAEVFAEVVFPDYSVGLHRPYSAVVLPQGLKTGASTAAAMVDRQCVLDQLNCYVGTRSFGETMRLDQPIVQNQVTKSKGMFGGSYPFDGWTGRSTMDTFLHSAVPNSSAQILTVVRDPADRVIDAWVSYRNSRGMFDMDLGDFIEMAYYDEDFRLTLENPRYAALDAISRELVGKSNPYGAKGFAEKFGENVIQKVLSGDWLLMVADRFEESVYIYMKKAYGFDWEDLIHIVPEYQSAEELTSTLSSRQIDMLRELQPYDYVLYETANIVLDLWLYRADNEEEHEYYYYIETEEDDADDYFPRYDDPMDDYDYSDVSCFSSRYYVANNYWGFSHVVSPFYNEDSNNTNNQSTGGTERMSAEICYLDFMNDYIEDLCDDVDDDVAAAAQVTREDNNPLTEEHTEIAVTAEEREERAPRSFLATSKLAAAFVKNLEQMEEKSVGLDKSVESASSKFKKRFADVSSRSKEGFQARKQKEENARLRAASKSDVTRTVTTTTSSTSSESSSSLHKDNLGVSKNYIVDDLEEYEAKICEFYELSHHSMMSWSRNHRNLKYPEDMDYYINNVILADYKDYSDAEMYSDFNP